MKYCLIMPENDPRTARIIWSKQKGDVMELCIAVDHDQPLPLNARLRLLLEAKCELEMWKEAAEQWDCSTSEELKERIFALPETY